uniref:Uncharacterized protein n=1 Tax=Zea mays TaxID=4577 RepID=A0A804RN49_MAIZE
MSFVASVASRVAPPRARVPIISPRPCWGAARPPILFYLASALRRYLLLSPVGGGIEPRARFGLGASDDGGSGPAAGSPGPQSAPAAVGGASSAPGASGSDGKPPVKRVMKTPYQLEVLERTYAGSSAIDDSETF